MKIYLSICLFFSLSVSPLAGVDNFLFGKSDNAHIEVNNRVLAYVNSKAITVVDVMKKMDMLFLKQFPEYTGIPQARFQYYQINWKSVLQELIDKELILADALENKIPLTAGDVRQEMESLFGPNIIANLDKIGLTLDEAFKIVQGDLLIRRTMMIRVNSKAMRSVTPQIIRESYNEFAAKNIKKETWRYQVVTIRNPDSALGAETAHIGHKLLTEDKVSLDELQDSLKDLDVIGKSSISISEPLYHTEADMAEQIKATVKEMETGDISQPLIQKSRTDKSSVFRIVVLLKKVPAGAVPYFEIENQIKNDLYDKAISRDSEAYLKKLRTHYAISDTYISEMVSEDFQPFFLK